MFLSIGKSQVKYLVFLVFASLIIVYERANFPAPLIYVGWKFPGYFAVYLSFILGVCGVFWEKSGKNLRMVAAIWILLTWLAPILVMYHPSDDNSLLVKLVSSMILSAPFIIAWILFLLKIVREKEEDKKL